MISISVQVYGILHHMLKMSPEVPSYKPLLIAAEAFPQRDFLLVTKFVGAQCGNSAYVDVVEGSGS